MHVKILTAAIAAVMSITTAQASLILSSPSNQPTDLTAFGFGTNGPLLTLQRTTSELGCVTPSGGAPAVGCAGTVFASNYSDSTSPGSYVNPTGFPKYNETTFGALGITNLSQFAILFNANESQPNTGGINVTVTKLSLRVYNASGVAVGSTISLAGAVGLSNISAGQGSAGFIFKIAPDQYALTGCSSGTGGDLFLACGGYQFGLAAEVTGTSGGAESFTLAKIGTGGGGGGGGGVVPEPSAYMLIGGGLAGVSLLSKLRRKSV